MKTCPGEIISQSGMVWSIVAGLYETRLHGIGMGVAEGMVVLVGMGISVGGMIGIDDAAGMAEAANLVSSGSIV